MSSEQVLIEGKNNDEVRAILAYGTLRADYTEDGDQWGVVDEDCDWVYGQTEGFLLFQENDVSYPFALYTGSKTNMLRGTVLRWDDEKVWQLKLAACDDIEGCSEADGWTYKRRICSVDIGEDKPILCYVYYSPHHKREDCTAERMEHFIHGDWLYARKDIAFADNHEDGAETIEAMLSPEEQVALMIAREAATDKKEPLP